MTEIVSRGPARGYSWAPFQPGHFKSKKHGAYSDRVITPLAAEIANAVCEARADLQAPEMQPAVLAYARSEAQLEVVTAYVDQCGAFTEAGELTSAEKYRLRLDTQTANHRSRLGLDPLSKAKLGKDIAATQVDLSIILAQLNAERDSAGDGK
ncbi:hypothetical protein GS473_04495 [Rhodococcus hoagii]|nr:hypothetical protein [Prescottella equi]